ncbi:MAG: nucleoside deaminase [Holosporaceae bacterium]|jgi:tRNA(Arg) A34 adenosine deaminase TadA|nr:nucleoside deaminase [Holosporaceae bacterium]
MNKEILVENQTVFTPKDFMELALDEALNAKKRGSVPVGAIIVSDRKIISMSGNEMIKKTDPTAHAEILAIQKACQIMRSRILEKCDIYVTLEPCAMCAQAISLARIRRLYFGAYDTKYGGTEHGARIFDHALHKTEVIGGILETQCMKILQNFFALKRI